MLYIKEPWSFIISSDPITNTNKAFFYREREENKEWQESCTRLKRPSTWEATRRKSRTRPESSTRPESTTASTRPESTTASTRPESTAATTRQGSSTRARTRKGLPTRSRTRSMAVAARTRTERRRRRRRRNMKRDTNTVIAAAATATRCLKHQTPCLGERGNRRSSFLSREKGGNKIKQKQKQNICLNLPHAIFSSGSDHP